MAILLDVWIKEFILIILPSLVILRQVFCIRTSGPDGPLILALRHNLEGGGYNGHTHHFLYIDE